MPKLNENFRLDDSIGYVVNLVANRMKIELEEAFAAQGYDISSMQWMVLSLVIEHPGISQNALAQMSKKDKTNIARVLEKLEKKGWIERLRDGKDRRLFRLYATEAGRGLRGDLSVIAADVVERALQEIPTQSLQTTLDTLHAIYDNLE